MAAAFCHEVPEKHIKGVGREKRRWTLAWFIYRVVQFVPAHQDQSLTNHHPSLFLLNTQRRKSRYAELDFEVSTSLSECVFC